MTADGAGGRRPDADETALWRHVARDVTPLSRPPASPEDAPPEDASPEGAPPEGGRAPAHPVAAPPHPAPPRPPAPPLPALDPAVPAGLDRRTARRLRRGRIPVEARLDLHGKTQDEAHAALGRFVRECRMAGRRCVMVITGKGSVASGQGGVLRRMTPRWLDEPALRRHVVAIATAPESAGGRGALYVLLKRRAGPEPS